MPQSHMNTSQANGECPFGVGCGTNMARKVCGYSWWSHPDGVSDFQHASPPHLTEVTPVVSQAQQSHCASVQTDCL